MTSGSDSGSDSVRVALIDDQAMFRAGIAMIVRSQSDLDLVGEAGDGRDALRLCREAEPDVVLMDVRMPQVDGVTATRELIAALGDRAPKVLVLTTFDLDESAAAAIEAGASGFVLKETEPEFLLAAIRTVAAGHQVFAASSTRTLLQRFSSRARSRPGPEFDELTAREREIMLRAAEGLSNAEIAAREYLSEGTVKTHMSRILTKLGLRDRTQLVVYAFRHGLL